MIFRLNRRVLGTSPLKIRHLSDYEYYTSKRRLRPTQEGDPELSDEEFGKYLLKYEQLGDEKGEQPFPEQQDPIRNDSAQPKTFKSGFERREDLLRQLRSSTSVGEILKTYRHVKLTEPITLDGDFIREVIQACGKKGGYGRTIESILADVERYRIPASADTYNAALEIFFERNEYKRILDIQNTMTGLGHNPNAKAYDILIKSAVRRGDVGMAGAQVRSALIDSVEIDPSTLGIAIQASFGARSIEQGRRLVEDLLEKHRTKLAVEHVVEVILVLSRGGHFRFVQPVLGHLKRMLKSDGYDDAAVDVGVLNELLLACAKSEELDLFHQFLQLLRRAHPNEILGEQICFAGAIGRAKFGDIRGCIDLLFELGYSAKDESISVRSLSGLTEILEHPSRLKFRTGGIDYLMQCWDRGQRVPLVALNCFISAHANTGRFDQAWNLVENLETGFGLSANVHTFNAILLACKDASTDEEARRVPLEMMKRNIAGNAETCDLLVGHLARENLTQNITAVIHTAISDGVLPLISTFRMAATCCHKAGEVISLAEILSAAKSSGYTEEEILNKA